MGRELCTTAKEAAHKKIAGDPIVFFPVLRNSQELVVPVLGLSNAFCQGLQRPATARLVPGSLLQALLVLLADLGVAFYYMAYRTVEGV